MKNLFLIPMLFSILFVGSSLISCNQEPVKVSDADYPNAEVFEKALNDGIDTVGKSVQFKVDNVKYNVFQEYLLWAGEHLNFTSKEDPGVQKGDEVVVTVTKTYLFLGSHMIEYKDLIVL